MSVAMREMGASHRDVCAALGLPRYPLPADMTRKREVWCAAFGPTEFGAATSPPETGAAAEPPNKRKRHSKARALMEELLALEVEKAKKRFAGAREENSQPAHAKRG